jgi:hypothetical protein
MVAEQLVTEFEQQDITPILINNTYWASYNNVYFPRFRDLSGEEKKVAEMGPQLYSWANSSRAKIFARDHIKVVNLTTMMQMMRLIDKKFLLKKPVFYLNKIDTMIFNMIIYLIAIVLHNTQQN